MAIAAGRLHNCIKTTAGSTYCWGDNSNKQTGNPANISGIPAYNLTPNLPGPVADVSVHTGCIVSAPKDIRCWGINGGLGGNANYGGGLGHPTPQTSPVQPLLAPVPLPPEVTQVVKVGVGGYYTCAIVNTTSANGKVLCWGNANLPWNTIVFAAGHNLNGAAALAASVSPPKLIPMYYVKTAANADITNAKKIETAGADGCVIDSANDLYCWGIFNPYVGNQILATQANNWNNATIWATKIVAPYGQNVKKVVMAQNAMCVLNTSGKVFCSGQNGAGQLGNSGALSSTQTAFGPVLGLPSNVADISGKLSQSVCALGTDNTAWCWGANNKGQLGDCTVTTSGKPTPVQVMKSCGVNPPPPPACGTAVSSGPYSSPPTANLCGLGTANAPALVGNYYNWTCTNGSSISCQAPAQNDNGVCNASTMGGTFPNPGPSATPPTNLCTIGNPTAVTQQTVSPYNWLWSCQGIGIGATQSCFARSVPVPINGACGPGNGNPPDASVAAIPTPYCSSGTPSPTIPTLNNTGNWASWSCVGANGGNNVQCGTKILAPTPKVVTPSAGAGCSISPNTPQTVSTGSTASFTITPSAGYKLNPTTGTCGGAMTSGVFTTNPVNNNCTVIANCSLCSKSDVINGLCGSVIIIDKLL